MPHFPVITSSQHPLIKHLLKLRTCKKHRTASKEVFVEGKKIVFDLAKTRVFSKLILTEDLVIPSSIRYQEKCVISQQNFNKISGVSTPSKIGATLTLPEVSPFDSEGNILVLDQLQDPGNIGTLTRTALALGFKGVFLIEGTADYFNDKTIRSSRGAVFSLPFQRGSEKNLIALAKKNKATLLIADIKGQSVKSLQTQPRPFYLVMGNESRGVSPLIKNEGVQVNIPMNSHVESLNVSAAGSILLYLLQGGSIEI